MGLHLIILTSRILRAGSLDRRKCSFRDPLHAPRFLAAPGRGPWIAKNARSGTPCLRRGLWPPSGGVPGSQKTLAQGPLACAAVHGRPRAGSLDCKKPSPRDPLPALRFMVGPSVGPWIAKNPRPGTPWAIMNKEACGHLYHRLLYKSIHSIIAEKHKINYDPIQIYYTSIYQDNQQKF